MIKLFLINKIMYVNMVQYYIIFKSKK